jgi:hypothetical protein
VLPAVPRLALAALGLTILVELYVLVPHAASVILAAVVLWMALPGVVLLRRTWGARTSDQAIAAWLVGPAIGIAVSVFGLLLIWSAGLQNWLALLLAPLLTWTLAWLSGRLGGLRIALPRLDHRDVLAAALVLLVVPLITFAPYANVRAAVPEGEAYRAYFTADFVWAMAATAELAKGDVPPANPFLRGEPMRYYWMAHLLSGAVYRNVRDLGITIEQVVLVNGLGFGIAFVTFVYWLARAVGARVVFAALAVTTGFVANSYEGIDRIWLHYREGVPIEFLRDINIDAVTRWFYQGMPVDGLQRLLLYQPHHLTGYVCALASLWLVGLAEDVTEIGTALWAGILLGLAFLFSTFTAIIVGLAVGLLYVGRLAQRGNYRSVWQCALLGGLPVGLAVVLSMVLGYTDPDEGLLIRVGSNRVALWRWPLMFLLSFGPLLFGAIAALFQPRWLLERGAAPFALVVSALLFYFLTDVPDMGGVWVGWRSGHLLLIAFATMGAAALTAAWSRGWLRPLIALAFACAVIPAIPTVAIDVYNAQDIENRGEGAGFPWTLVLTHAEREALDWVRQNTAADAVVQVEPTIRGPGTWAYVPAFAERRMAAGLPISMIPLQPYQIAMETIRLGIFRAGSADEAHRMSRYIGIDYLLAGEPERHVYEGTLAYFAARPDLFPVVFSNDAITIYRIAR